MLLKVIAIGLIFSGYYFISGTLKEHDELDYLKERGVKTPGTITLGVKNTDDVGATSYRFTVQWKTANGEKREKILPVTGKFAERHCQFAERRFDGSRISDPNVTVCYLANDPGKAFVVGGEDDSNLGIYFGAVTCAAGMFGTWYLFFRKS